MILEHNKQIARRYLEQVLGARDLAELDEIVTPDVILHGASGKMFAGRDALRQILTKNADAIEHTELTIDCELAERDSVVTVYTSRGLHVAEYHGVAPSGREIVVSAANIFVIRDDTIREIRVVMDQLELLRQLRQPAA